MKIFAEKKAEDFLEKNGFEVVKRKFINKKFLLKRHIRNFGFPFVMKVSGNKIIHKNKIGGVKFGIKTYSEALYEYSKLSRIKNSEGVVIQEQLKGTEIFFGIKKTNEFGQVILFGQGWTNVESSRNVNFGILPLSKSEIRQMIKKNSYGRKLSNKSFLFVEKNMIKLNTLIEKNQNIVELDINPFIVSDGCGKICDARIVFD